MCGIIGWIRLDSKSKFNSKKVFKESAKELMKSVESRGRDACGFISCNDDGLYFQKYSYKASTFLRRKDKKINQLIAKSDLFTFHTRFGTGGSPRKLINNHPHVSKDGRFMLVHNGVLDDDTVVADRYKKYFKGECDTEFLLKYIEVESWSGKKVPEILKHFMSEVYGDFAVVIYDWQERKVYFFRKGRPLYFADYGDFLVYGSTLDIINDFVDTYSVKKPEGFFDLDTDKVISFDMKGGDMPFSFEGEIKKYASRSYNRSYLSDDDTVCSSSSSKKDDKKKGKKSGSKKEHSLVKTNYSDRDHYLDGIKG